MPSIPCEENPLGVSGGKSWSDYIVYVSCGQLTAQSGKADTGQGLTLYNISSSNFIEYGGVPCIDMTSWGAQYARLTEPSVNFGPAMPRSYSVWLAPTSYRSGYMRGIAIGSYAANRELCSPNNFSYSYEICAGGNSVDLRTGKYLKANVWSHIVQNYFADGTIDIWLNGERIGHFTGQSIDIQSPLMSLGAPTDSTSNPYSGYVSTARLWNRTLKDSEIKDLSEELQPMYTISAQDLSFSLYQKTETYGISYSSAMSPTFEIVEGELPPEISFDASTGKFTGKGPTDGDHVYTLKVKLSAPDSYSAVCAVRISTYKTARISFPSQSLSFITEEASSADISFTADEQVTFEIVQGELPAGVSLTGSTVHSTGEQTSAQEKTVLLRAKSEHNQEGVTASVTFSVILNRITLLTSGVRLYAGSAGPSSKRLLYLSQRSISPVWSIEGSLPAGVTFDAENGVMRGDSSSYGGSSTVTVTVASSTGRSAPATAAITVDTLSEPPVIPGEYAVYIPMSGLYADSPAPDVTVTNYSESDPVTFAERGGVSFGVFAPDYSRSLKVNNATSCFPYQATPRTVSFWIRRPLRDSDSTILWYGNAYGAGKCYCLKLGRSGWPFIDLYNYGTDNNIAEGSTDGLGRALCDGKWHHAAVTLWSENSRAYSDVWIDGNRAYRSYAAVSLNTGTAYSYAIVGGYSEQYNWKKSLNGELSRLRVYGRALSESEIKALSDELSPTD